MSLQIYSFCYNCHKCESPNILQVKDLDGKIVGTVKKLQECGACHIATYCNQTCQMADWSKHKTTCLKRDTVLSRKILNKSVRFDYDKKNKQLKDTFKNHYSRCFINIDLKTGSALTQEKMYKLCPPAFLLTSRTHLPEKLQGVMCQTNRLFTENLKTLSDLYPGKLLISVKIRLPGLNAEGQWAKPVGNFMFTIARQFTADSIIGNPKEALKLRHLSPAFGLPSMFHRGKCPDCNQKYSQLNELELNALDDLVREIEFSKALKREKPLNDEELGFFGLKTTHKGIVPKEEILKLQDELKTLLQGAKKLIGIEKYAMLQKMALHITSEF